MMTIDKSLCLECGACISVCPSNIFQRGEDGKVFARQKPCIDCFHCSAVCPAKAVGHQELGREACYPAPAPEGSLLRKFQKRRSIRHFSSRVPDRAVIQAALDGAAYAPSGHNARLYQWTVVLGRERVERIRRLVLDMARNVPDLRGLILAEQRGLDLVTCGAPCLIFVHSAQSSPNYAMDATIAATLADQLLADQGLGACWGGYLCLAATLSPELAGALELPEDQRICAVLMAGYPAERYVNIPPRPAARIHWVE